MRRISPYANQVIDKLITAAETLDPIAVNEFFNNCIQAELCHLDLIRSTLTDSELLRRHLVLSQGGILLTLFNHFAASKPVNRSMLVRNGFISDENGFVEA